MRHTELTGLDYFLIDCNTTYFNIAADYYLTSQKHHCLLYLADCQWRYSENIIESDASDGKDPFFHQPIRLYNRHNDILFETKSFGDFLIFLKKGFNLKSKILFGPLAKEKLIDKITEAFEKNQLVIINVDSYHCPCRKLYYQSIHNQHGLLIKGFDPEKNIVEVIDTNFSQSYQLDFDKVTAGFNSDSLINTLIRIDGNNAEPKLDFSERLNSFLENCTPLSFIENTVTKLHRYLFTAGLNKADREFHLKRYIFPIKFQLLPYLRMRSHLFHANNITEFADNLKNSILYWILLSDILVWQVPWDQSPPAELIRPDKPQESKYKIENYDLNSVFEMLDKVRTIEDELFASIQALRNVS